MIERTEDGTAFELTGPPDAPVVAFIHGLGLCQDMWQETVPHFADYRVLTYDLYGHGDSGPVPQTATLQVFGDQLAHLLDHIGAAAAHVVGFSIGGMINRRLAMDHAARVSSLIILNSPHNRGDTAQKAVEARAKAVREQGAMATMQDALKRWFTPKFLRETNALAEAKRASNSPPELETLAPHRVQAWRQRVDPESYAQTVWVLAHGVRELINPKPAVTHPTLVMTCENDSGSTPQMARDIAAEIVGAELQIVPELQHLGLMEAPDLFVAPMLKFLRKGAQ